MARRLGPRLTKERIRPSRVIDGVEDPGAGATVVFLGTVRDNSSVGRVKGIEYEAYRSMAEKSLARAEEEAMLRWPATRQVRILHRVGSLSVGEVSVAVAVSSAHRAEAFEACRFVIEAIKHEAPIWKREKMVGGKEVWVEGAPLEQRRKRTKALLRTEVPSRRVRRPGRGPPSSAGDSTEGSALG